MSFSFTEAKLRARRVVHDTLGVDAAYQGTTVSPLVDMKVRWHGRIIRNGDLDDYGWSDVIEGIDHIVFDVEEARRVGVKVNGVITLKESGGAKFRLVARLPTDGPVKETWSVARIDE